MGDIFTIPTPTILNGWSSSPLTSAFDLATAQSYIQGSPLAIPMPSMWGNQSLVSAYAAANHTHPELHTHAVRQPSPVRPNFQLSNINR